MTTDELKLLLSLNGNKRLLHMEDEIFADDLLTEAYMSAIVPYLCYISGETERYCQGIVFFAEHTLNCHWPAAEQYLYRHPINFYTQYYIRHMR